jgi:hypothetical protein
LDTARGIGVQPHQLKLTRHSLELRLRLAVFRSGPGKLGRRGEPTHHQAFLLNKAPISRAGSLKSLYIGTLKVHRRSTIYTEKRLACLHILAFSHKYFFYGALYPAMDASLGMG